MRCLNCHQDGLPPDTKFCPYCNMYLPGLMRDILPPGTRLRGKDFQIEYALGRGGFGITYRAHQTGLDRPVAIKEFYHRDSCQRLPQNFTISVAHNHKDMFDKWLTRFVREGRQLDSPSRPVKTTRSSTDVHMVRLPGDEYAVPRLVDAHSRAPAA